MRPMTKKNKIAAVALSATLLAAGGGAAYAYWSTTGAGSGQGAVGSGTTPVTISVTVESGVVPGGPAKSISYKATNPNTSSTPVTLNDAVVSTNRPDTCDAKWFTATIPAGATTVLPGATTSLGAGELTLADLPSVDQNGCQGATITVTATSH